MAAVGRAAVDRAADCEGGGGEGGEGASPADGAADAGHLEGGPPVGADRVVVALLRMRNQAGGS